MFFSIISLHAWASPTCKILIETCCDQSGEVLADPIELCQFYLALPEEVKEVVAICLDTTHVFVAGYNPIEYLKILERMNVPVAKRIVMHVLAMVI